MKLVLATGNKGKAAEIGLVLGTVPGLEVVERPADLDDPIEDGDTLLDNARIKARAVVTATGLAAVADDTGLAVHALDGAPGVHTARYAGPDATYDDNIDKLLGALAELSDDDDRRATWSTIALVTWPDGTELWTEGRCDGVITRGRRGAGGFGYDPIFVPDEGDGRAFAELTTAEKNLVSHRGRAFQALGVRLREQMAR
jgi:XTP/dITP diphosphohydrolase